MNRLDKVRTAQWAGACWRKDAQQQKHGRWIKSNSSQEGVMPGTLAASCCWLTRHRFQCYYDKGSQTCLQQHMHGYACSTSTNTCWWGRQPACDCSATATTSKTLYSNNTTQRYTYTPAPSCGSVFSPQATTNKTGETSEVIFNKATTNLKPPPPQP